MTVTTASSAISRLSRDVRPKRLTRGERVIAFIERYCRVPEGVLIGKPMRLMAFQKKFILAIYDNPAVTARAYLSVGRKNGKTALIAAILLAHLVGPEAVQNSQITSGARSRKQAALVFKLAHKMVMLSAELTKLVKPVPSDKMLVGLPMNVEYQAVSAEAGTAHGLSPILAILDEVGQVKGPYDAFVEAIETAQGAYEGQALLIAISTQAATDADLFSIWIDDAEASKDPKIVSHVYTAPPECDLMDRKGWDAANPALGEFRSLTELEEFAIRAVRMPSSENTFRWLYLNQRVEAKSPFISRSVWKACAGVPLPFDTTTEVYIGLDLSEVNDLTAEVAIGKKKDAEKWDVFPTFWLPEVGLAERSRQDRVPYDLWASQGYLDTIPGKSIDYEFVAYHLFQRCKDFNVKAIAFDRWNFKHLRPWLVVAGFTDLQIDGGKDGVGKLFIEFGQGFQSMSPALRTLEGDILNERLAHGGHPVLTLCANNAVVIRDPAGNRKLVKGKSSGRIDGMVALTMARGVVPLEAVPAAEKKFQMIVI